MYADLALENKPMEDLIEKSAAKAASFLVTEVQAVNQLGSHCVGLSQAAYYRTAYYWAIRDVEVIDVLNDLVKAYTR